MKYAVYDWTGRRMTYYGEFESYEDAWGRIYEEFEDLDEKEFEEQMGEFYVEALANEYAGVER
jgi:hypothetical protein